MYLPYLYVLLSLYSHLTPSVHIFKYKISFQVLLHIECFWTGYTSKCVYTRRKSSASTTEHLNWFQFDIINHTVVSILACKPWSKLQLLRCFSFVYICLDTSLKS